MLGKKNKKKPAAKAGAKGKADNVEAGEKKPGLLGKFAMPVVLGITSFATVYFLPRTVPEAAVTQAADTHGETAHSDGEEDKAPIVTTFVEMESFTVSLRGRSRILRLGIALETPEDQADYIDPNDPKLRDAFMGYLSALDMEQVEDAAFLVRLRAQLTKRATFVLGPDTVQNILITDFMVR